MRIGALKRHWERLGRHDPYWAVLTDPDKRRGRWDLAEFFHSGVDDISGVMERATSLGLEIRRERALDFGCGVGRLTQALGRYFERCDGVDISSSMLSEARRHNGYPDRCTYHLNAAPDLALFGSGIFTFAYSALVLQHMEPRYSKVYIRELLRVLQPGGVLVFQLPSHRASQAPDSSATCSHVGGPLPPEAFRARLTSSQSALSIAAGTSLTIPVTVENVSDFVWPALGDTRGRYRINLANHWLHADAEMFQRDDDRCPLPHDLAPGMRAELLLGGTSPAFSGDYLLEVDLVQENVAWFSEHGTVALRVPCHVTGGTGEAPPRTARELTRAAPGRAPFRQRHPRLFRLFRATGVRDAYWAWRRGVDHVKRRRDRVILLLRGRWFGRVLPRLINWWKSNPFAPRMEMHCVSRGEVVAIVESAGARCIDVEEELIPGGFQSCRYWIRKE